MVDLVVVRHAQSTWNAEGRWQGWADPPLTALGRDQAVRAAAGLRAHPPVRVIASDLRRAAETGGTIAAALGRPCALDADLREYDAGEWSGLRRSEISARWPDDLAAWDAGVLDRTPGGEDPRALVARMRRAVCRAADEGAVHAVDAAAAAGGPAPGAAAAADAGPHTGLWSPIGPWVLVVSHGRAINALVAALGGRPARIGHLEGWELVTRDEREEPPDPIPGRPVRLLADSLAGAG